MKMNQNIDESLNSFIDGELTDSRQSEVQRLIANDPQVAQRLRELRACKALVSSLPRAEAPAGIPERVKASLPRTYLQGRSTRMFRPTNLKISAGLVRRVVAAAAVVGLIVVLAAVMQTLIPSDIAPDRPARHAGQVAEAGFTGRLELKTAALVAVDASINKAIHNNGLSDCVVATQIDGKKVYSLRCSREGLNLLLADLDNVWQRFDSATLFVDTAQFGKPIVIDAVTAKQTAEVINQENFTASAKLAKDIAVLNNLAESMPGKDILAAVGDSAPSLTRYWTSASSVEPRVPKPFLTWNKQEAKDLRSEADDSEKVSLTIVVASE